MLKVVELKPVVEWAGVRHRIGEPDEAEMEQVLVAVEVEQDIGEVELSIGEMEQVLVGVKVKLDIGEVVAG